jgi:hypothetical protein
LQTRPCPFTINSVDGDGLIERSEVAAMLFAVADINANVERIKRILEMEYGEEEDSEDDS